MGLELLEALFEEVFWIKMVFPLVIHSGIPIFCKHLFLSIASQSGMEVIFLNQYPLMPSWPAVFQFGTFF